MVKHQGYRSNSTVQARVIRALLMTTMKQPAGQVPGQFKSDLILMMVMLPVYFAVWERFGLKFLAGVGISFITGICCWLLALICQPGPENRDVAQVPFAWLLFVFFPLFCPLGLPLWLIPVILIISYLVSISSFGGYGRHFFNPVAFAVIFMLCGYAGTASLGASRPLPKKNALPSGPPECHPQAPYGIFTPGFRQQICGRALSAVICRLFLAVLFRVGFWLYRFFSR